MWGLFSYFPDTIPFSYSANFLCFKILIFKEIKLKICDIDDWQQHFQMGNAKKIKPVASGLRKLITHPWPASVTSRDCCELPSPPRKWQHPGSQARHMFMIMSSLLFERLRQEDDRLCVTLGNLAAWCEPVWKEERKEERRAEWPGALVQSDSKQRWRAGWLFYYLHHFQNKIILSVSFRIITRILDGAFCVYLC